MKKGSKHTEESKQKITESKLGHATTDETKQKLSESLKGKINSEYQRQRTSETNKGKKHTEEHVRKRIETRFKNGTNKITEQTKLKMSKARLGKPATHLYKKVLVVNLDTGIYKTFDSVTVCAKYYGFTRQCISLRCLNKTVDKQGNKWSYLEEGKNNV